MMGQVLLGDPPHDKPITLLEPCAESGAMVSGFVNAMMPKKLNWINELTITVINSDEKCVHRAFLQFSLYGIYTLFVVAKLEL